MLLRTNLASALIAGLLFVTSASADLFPYQQGTRWEFGYTRTVSGMIGSTLDSGTIEWQVLWVLQTGSIPPNMAISIEQTRNLERRISTSFDPNLSYDSTYRPPQVTIDTIAFTGTGGVNGWVLVGDSCWSLIHDETDPTNRGMVLTTEVDVVYQGRGLKGTQVDASPCRGDTGAISVRGPQYFTQVHGLGPVGFYIASSPLLLDARFEEIWTLTDAPGLTEIEKMPSTLGAHWKTTIDAKGRLEFFLDQPEYLSVEAVFLNGQKISILAENIYERGRYQLNLDPQLTGNRVWILNIKGKDYKESRLVSPSVFK